MGHVCIMLRQFGTFLKHVEFLRDPRSNARSNLTDFSVECTVKSCEVLGRMHGPERETDKSAAGGRQAYTININNNDDDNNNDDNNHDHSNKT